MSPVMDLQTFSDQVEGTDADDESVDAPDDTSDRDNGGAGLAAEVATTENEEPTVSDDGDGSPDPPQDPPIREAALPAPDATESAAPGLPVPTRGSTPGMHPVHMPFKPTGKLKLPDRELLVPPVEPDWHDPFYEPQPRTWGRFGQSRVKAWELRRDNHNGMIERQQQEYADARAAHWLAIEELRGVMAYMQRQLYEASRRAGTSRVFAPAHSKGGVGKTPSATTVAAVCGQATRLPVFLVDANPYRGGAAGRSGVELGDVLTVTEVMQRHETMTMNDFLERTNPTEYGVLTIASDPEAVRPHEADEFTAMIESLKKLTPIIVIDTGNDVLGELNRAIYRMASTLMFPMLTVWGPQTVNGPVDDLLGTKHSLQLMAKADERDLSFEAKTQLGVTIALGLTPDQSEREFRDAAGAEGLMLTVPWDDTAATPQPLVLPTKDGPLTPTRGVIDPYTAVAWTKVALACFEQAEAFDKLATATAGTRES